MRTPTLARLVAGALVVFGLVAGFALSCGRPAKAADASQLDQFLATYHADVASSVKLPDGRVLWLFGDTFGADGSFRRNTAVVQNSVDNPTFTKLPGTFGHPHKTGEEADWYWPGEAYIEYGKLRVLMQQYHCVNSCTALDDAVYEGTDIVTYNLPDLTYSWTRDLPMRQSGAHWSQVFIDRDGTRYFYGAYAVSGQFGKAYEIATVGPDLNSTTLVNWVYQPSGLDPGLELGQVSSVVRTLQGYKLYSKHADFWYSDIISYDGPTPMGPWTNRQSLATPIGPDGSFTYAVEAHPEQQSSPLVLTYATNCTSLCDEYHASAIEVPVPTLTYLGSRKLHRR